jgi:hypothetical protein
MAAVIKKNIVASSKKGDVSVSFDVDRGQG